MKKLTLLMIAGLCGLLTPMMAQAGAIGACLIEAPDTSAVFPDGTTGEGCFAVCVDGTTEQECDIAKANGGWYEGQTCGEIEVPWDWEGGCQADVPPFGDQCYIIACGGNAELICEVEVGVFFPDDLSCGLGVPTMPAFGMGLMVLLILGGALILLTVRGSLTV